MEKSSKYLILIFLLSLTLIISVGVLFYLLNNSYTTISDQNIKIEELEESVNSYKSISENNSLKIENISKYNDLLTYVFGLFTAHPTLTGFTEDEYLIALDKAKLTKDENLIEAVENIWENRDGKPVERFTLAILAITDGIKSEILRGNN